MDFHGLWDIDCTDRFLSGLTNSHNLKKPIASQTIPCMQKSFSGQLDIFFECGFHLNPGITVEDLLIWPNTEKAYEEDPFRLLYKTLGHYAQRGSYPPFCNNCWTLDMEFIRRSGAYTHILSEISRLSGYDLFFEDVKDIVDLDEKKGSVSFRYAGKEYNWEMKQEDEWVDGTLFERIQYFCEQNGNGKLLTYFDPGDTSIVLGYATKDELRNLRSKTGLNIALLESMPV